MKVVFDIALLQFFIKPTNFELGQYRAKVISTKLSDQGNSVQLALTKGITLNAPLEGEVDDMRALKSGDTLVINAEGVVLQVENPPATPVSSTTGCDFKEKLGKNADNW